MKEREKVAVRKEDEHGTERKTRNEEVGKEESDKDKETDDPAAGPRMFFY